MAKKINGRSTVLELINKLHKQTQTKDSPYSNILYALEVDPDTKITSLLEDTYPWRQYKYGNREDADDMDVAQVDCDEDWEIFYVSFSEDFLEGLEDKIFVFDSELEAESFILLMLNGITRGGYR